MAGGGGGRPGAGGGHRGLRPGAGGERQEGEAGVGALKEAIAAYDLALEVYTQEHFPFLYRMVQENRESAYRLLKERGAA